MITNGREIIMTLMLFELLSAFGSEMEGWISILYMKCCRDEKGDVSLCILTE